MKGAFNNFKKKMNSATYEQDFSTEYKLMYFIECVIGIKWNDNENRWNRYKYNVKGEKLVQTCQNLSKYVSLA